MSTRSFVILVGFSLLAGCSGPGTAEEIVATAIAAQGGQAQLEAVNSIVRRGSGTGAMVGQVPTPDAPTPSAELTNYTEAIDFVNGRTMVDYDLTFGEFQQHRREVLTDYGSGADALTVGYQMANDQGAVVSPNALFSFATPYHTPQLASARDPITVLFRASVDTESSMQVVLEREFNGIDCLRFQIDLMGRTAELFFDPDTSLMVGYLVFETDPYLGDVETAYVFEDYRDVDGLLLPHEMWVRKDGLEVAHMTYDSIETNQDLPEADFMVPEEMAEDAEIATVQDFVPLELNRLSAGVYHAVGFSHHSLVIEFPDYIVVVEAPWSDTQAKVLIDEIGNELGRLKPIEYVVVTHPHPDHVGGLRRFVASGSTVLVEERHRETIQNLIDARHGYTADELHTVVNTLGRSDNIGTVEAYDGEYELSDGSQSLTLHALESPHVMPMVVAYLPQQRILFESDLYTPGVPAATPDAIALLESITDLGLEVDTIVGGHGGSGDFEALAALAEAP